MRRMTGAAIAAGVLFSTMAIASPASGQSDPPKPTAAVAMGDSFISGEGAEDVGAGGGTGVGGGYQTVVDNNGVERGFEGWDGDNANPYYCHRSDNALIEVAELDRIDERFNIACSGGKIFDIDEPSHKREGGRLVDSQLDQLKAVAETHDIDLVVINLGANDVGFTPTATYCIGEFITDAYVGWWDVLANINFDLKLTPLHWAPNVGFRWIHAGEAHNTTAGACGANDFPGADEFAATQERLIAALQLIVDKLEEVDQDGEHRIVLQDYVNPLPEEFHRDYHEQNNRSDTRDMFKALARERYAGGCPIHRGTLPHARSMTEGIGQMISNAQDSLLRTNPDADIVYLNVQDAFNGNRLCENSGSPSGAFHTPTRARDKNGRIINSLTGDYNSRRDVGKLFASCTTYFQLCQESLHPNAAGHALLGECLTGAWKASHAMVWCNGSGGQVSPIQLHPSLDPRLSMRVSEGLDRNGNEVIVLDASWALDLVDAPGRSITSTSVRFNTGSTMLATDSRTSGAASATVRCSGSSTTIYASLSVTLDDGTRVNASDSKVVSCPGQSNPPGRGTPIR